MSGQIDRQIERQSAAILAHHGRSFAWASPFLPRGARGDAAVAYAFCREIDDLADEAPSLDQARHDLEIFERELDGTWPARALVGAWRELERRRGIDKRAARDLMKGVLSDLEEVRVADDDELLLYCYRVAGTVGLMMTRIIGATDAEATRHAVDLGIAMQLTNICRDVTEDAARGRVYLPASRLRAAGVDPDEVRVGHFDRERVAGVVRDLLALADRFYASGEAGMRFIPPRARLAIWIAARVYRAIGVKVARMGARAFDERARTGLFGKLRWTASAVAAFFGVGRLRAVRPPAAAALPSSTPLLRT
jgi:phytoene synthase